MGLFYASRHHFKRRISSGVESALKQFPELLDPASAPFDVLPVSVALHRVDWEDSPPIVRHQSSPAELSSFQFGHVKGPDEKKPVVSAKQVLWLVFLFVALDTSKSLAVSWAAMQRRMCAPLVICAKNALSIGCGMIMAGSLDGTTGVRACLNMRRALKVLPIAGAFCAAQIFSLQALRAFDPGSLKIIAQVNLPTTALLSWLLIGRRYSAHQWVAISLLLTSTVAFLQVRMLFFDPPRYKDEDEASVARIPDKVVGMLYFLTGIALSCSASVFAERFLKNRYDIPFYIQKTNLMFGELLAAVLMVHFNNRGQTGEICSWEQMSEWGQLPVALIWFVHGWIAGVLVKRCSALVKNVSHILSALVTYLLPSLVFGGTELVRPVSLSALLVLISVLVFATVPKPPANTRHERHSSSRSGSKRKKHHREMEPDPMVLAQPQMHRASSDQALSRKGMTRSSRQPLRDRGLTTATGNDAALSNSLLPVAAKPTAASVPVTASTVRHRVRAEEAVSVGFLMLCFILLDATKPLLVTWAHQQKAPEERFIHGTFMLVQTTLSLAVGLAIAVMPSVSFRPLSARLHPLWRSRLSRCVDLTAVMKQLPCAVCLCLSKLLMLMALGRMDAGTVRVFAQGSLPLVGVGSAIFLSKRYSVQQWCSLVAISVALITFYYVKAEVRLKNDGLKRPMGRGIEIVGVLLLFASICFNCMGALIVEKFLKGDRGRLHEQKAQLLLGEVVVNGFLLLALPFCFSDPALRQSHSPWHRGFFAGWDSRVLMCAMIWIPAGWTTTMLVKRCSNLLKTIAQGTSGVLTYVFSVVPLSRGPRFWSFFVTTMGPPLTPEPLSSPVVLLAIAVMLSALMFGSDSATDGGGSRSEARRSSGMQEWKVDAAYKQLAQRLPVLPPQWRHGGQEAQVPGSDRKPAAQADPRKTSALAERAAALPTSAKE